MKQCYTIFLLTILQVIFTTSFAPLKAQEVKPYLVVISSEQGKQSGIIYKADSLGLIIDRKDQLVRVPVRLLKKVKIKVFKGKYKIKAFAEFKDWEQNNYTKNADGFPVKKSDGSAPDLSDELNGRAAIGIYNILANVISAPVHAINPAINSFEFNNYQSYFDSINALNYYSIFCQTYPSFLKLPPLKVK